MLSATNKLSTWMPISVTVLPTCPNDGFVKKLNIQDYQGDCYGEVKK